MVFLTLGPTVLDYERYFTRHVFNKCFLYAAYLLIPPDTYPPPPSPPFPRKVGPPLANRLHQNTIIPCPEYHLQFYICSCLFFANIYVDFLYHKCYTTYLLLSFPLTYTHLTLPSQLLSLNKNQKTLLFFTPFYLRHAARSPVHRMALRHTGRGITVLLL